MRQIQGLAEESSPMILRGFQDTAAVWAFDSEADEAGEVAPRTFGFRRVVKDSSSRNRQASIVTRANAIPMHYEGCFLFKKVTDENGIERSVPRILRFQYYPAPSP